MAKQRRFYLLIFKVAQALTERWSTLKSEVKIKVFFLFSEAYRIDCRIVVHEMKKENEGKSPVDHRHDASAGQACNAHVATR
ncbi:hypothetical protein ACFQ1T_11545 [Methylophilus glucosoxydans]|uniref:Uncharacterized protein n=1 Tax=Methylophilus glucosoxydans TaxID=752553 RepID=A0ABW3GIG8_9PROT